MLETNLVSMTTLDAADVIAGASRTIAEHRPTILAEAWLHSWYEAERQRLRLLLESLDYTVGVVPGWPEMLWAVRR